MDTLPHNKRCWCEAQCPIPLKLQCWALNHLDCECAVRTMTHPAEYLFFNLDPSEFLGSDKPIREIRSASLHGEDRLLVQLITGLNFSHDE